MLFEGGFGRPFLFSPPTHRREILHFESMTFAALMA
jgi:hypothetical protein